MTRDFANDSKHQSCISQQYKFVSTLRKIVLNSHRIIQVSINVFRQQIIRPNTAGILEEMVSRPMGYRKNLLTNCMS